jgi:HAD superfamily hydrolase (TIGR01484 family)
MHKLLVFDLDGTLAPVGKGALPETIEKLKALENAGHRIALCSGKPTYYLCGILRQWELRKPIMIGENGAVFQLGVDLPPAEFMIFPYSDLARKQLRLLKDRIDSEWKDPIWYQPNEVAVTPFPYDDACFEYIQSILDLYPEDLTELAVYRHSDCFDILPKSINKAEGIAYFVSTFGLTPKDVVTVGDGVNDLPMFEYADLSIGIGHGVTGKATLSFETIGEALDYLLTNDM